MSKKGKRRDRWGKMNYEEFIEKYAENRKIVMLKHQKNTYKAIAKLLNISSQRVRQRYFDFCYKLYRCYCFHLESIQIEIDRSDILTFYNSIQMAIAYLEKTYKESLNVFRQGEPPIMFGYYKTFPTYRRLTDKQLLNLEKRIVDAKINQNKIYGEIGRELKLTNEKVKHIFDFYYHKKIITAIELIEPTVDFCFSDYIYKYSHSPQLRWKRIVEEYTELVQNLIEEY